MRTQSAVSTYPQPLAPPLPSLAHLARTQTGKQAGSQAQFGSG
jgi:hypothetical protein